jgi:hypothetical protein
MKKSRKLVLNRETLHSLDLRDVTGAGSYAVCTTLAGTTQTTNTSNSYTATAMTCGTANICSDSCSTGGACTT